MATPTPMLAAPCGCSLHKVDIYRAGRMFAQGVQRHALRLLHQDVRCCGVGLRGKRQAQFLCQCLGSRCLFWGKGANEQVSHNGGRRRKTAILACNQVTPLLALYLLIRPSKV